MKIIQLNSNLWASDRNANNAIYSHVGSLCDYLTERGHEVALFGSSASNTKAKLYSVLEGELGTLSLSERIKRHYINLLISNAYNHAKTQKFDVLHSHFTLNAAYFAHIADTPTLISVHSPIDEEIRPILSKFQHLRYISFSLAQRKQMPDLNWYANIYHGIDTNLFAFNEHTDSYEYVLYLGRITHDKGLHLAIEAAKRAGKILLIAGKTYETEGYWQKEIEPHIDGVKVRYVGQKSLNEKIELLQKAQALIFPTQCEEAFGYSMIEALSCGTPVIGWNSGSIPEIIKNDHTGFVVESVDEMVQALKNVTGLRRKDCRNRAEQFFSIKKMITGYESIYARVIEEDSIKRAKT